MTSYDPFQRGGCLATSQTFDATLRDNQAARDFFATGAAAPDAGPFWTRTSPLS